MSASLALTSRPLSWRVAFPGLRWAYSTRARDLGVARRRRAQRPRTALVPADLGEIEKHRGCVLETARFHFFWRCNIYLFAVISFLVVIVVVASFDNFSLFSVIISVSRLRPVFTDRQPPWAGPPSSLFHPPPPRLVGTRVQTVRQQQEQQHLHSIRRNTEKNRLNNIRHLSYLRGIFTVSQKYYGGPQ